MSHDPIASPTDTPNFIDNEFSASKATQWFPVHDPATNNLVTRVPQSTPEELSSAVASAQKAFPTWRATSIIARQQILFRFTHLIKENWDRLAASITLEQGKTFKDARGDVLRGLQVAEGACGITTQLPGEVLEVARDMETRSYREPLGVVAAICPFNFPAMIPLWCIPIAVVTGNTMILKPSERDPGAALILAELAREAGFPKGVLNIIHGSVDTVNFILDDPAISAISFVGSNRAGEYIYARGSANGKRVQANLGAKNHAVLLPDADKEATLNAITGAAFGAAGQRCMALSVLVTVGDSSSYIPELVEKAQALVVSGGFEKHADVGPVISPESKARIESLIANAERDGAKIILDGRAYKPEKYPNGNFVCEIPILMLLVLALLTFSRWHPRLSPMSQQIWNATEKKYSAPFWFVFLYKHSKKLSNFLTPMSMAMGHVFSPSQACQLHTSRKILKQDKWVLMFQSQSHFPCSPSPGIRRASQVVEQARFMESLDWHSTPSKRL
jgi:malonate-semialdehyde dehydrogenase (acetylating)/methylmalonate-semialdehyde dehydrogenase